MPGDSIELSVTLWPVVRRVLERFRLPYHASSRLNASTHATTSRWTSRPWEAVDELVSHQIRGLIRTGAGVSAPEIIARVAKYQPDSRVMVVCATREEVRKIGRNLEKLLDDVEWVIHDRWPIEGKRVMVTTFMRQALDRIMCHRWPITILPRALDLTGRQAAWIENQLCPDRLYGLWPLSEQLTRYDEDLLRTRFGFAEAVVHRAGEPGRQMQYAAVDVRRCSQQPGTTNLVSLKRKLLWTNPIRNRVISRLARGIADGSSDPALGEVTRLSLGESPRITVLVESVEQALALGTFLPTAPICCDKNAFHWLAPPQRRLLQAREEATGSTRLCTLAALSEDVIANTDVLIRADGNGDVPRELDTQCLPGRCPFLLVDIQDQTHPKLVRWASERLNAYQWLGWNRPGEYVDNVDRFLAPRIKLPRAKSMTGAHG
jgi:hypothetical protein